MAARTVLAGLILLATGVYGEDSLVLVERGAGITTAGARREQGMRFEQILKLVALDFLRHTGFLNAGYSLRGEGVGAAVPHEEKLFVDAQGASGKLEGLSLHGFRLEQGNV